MQNKCGAEYEQWVTDPAATANMFHGGFNTYRGTGKNHRSQCVYNTNGYLIDSGPFMGTYDFNSPLSKNGSHSAPGLVGHFFKDVIPHRENSNYTPNLTTQY